MGITPFDRRLNGSIVKAIDQEPSQDGAFQWQYQRKTRGALFTFLVFTFYFFMFHFLFFPIEHNVKFNFRRGNFIFELNFFILDPIYFWFGLCFGSPCLIWWNASKSFDFHIRGLIWGPRMFLQPATSTVWMHAFFSKVSKHSSPCFPSLKIWPRPFWVVKYRPLFP